MIKISLSGKAGVGKDTVANIFTQILNDKEHNCAKIAFADPIKEIISIMFPDYDYNSLYGDSNLRSNIIPDAYKDGLPLTWRQALLDIGTGIGRKYKESMWLDVFEHRVKEAILKDSSARFGLPEIAIINPDLRFTNEFYKVKSLGFKTIRIKRHTDYTINHVSETQQEEILDNQFDCVINNNSDIDYLRSCCLNIINNWDK